MSATNVQCIYIKVEEERRTTVYVNQNNGNQYGIYFVDT